MPGESWRQVFQCAKEVTEGTILPATRKIYATGDIKFDRPTNTIKAQNGSRSNTIAARPRAANTTADLKFNLSADEMLEVMACTIQGGVTPTTTLGASTWVFKPNNNALDTMTLESYDGYNGWVANGCKGDTFKLTGKANADISCDWTVWARNRVQQTITAGLTDRTPQYIEGWEAKVYVDAFGATAGTTVFPGNVVDYDLTFNNHLGRKVFAANTAATGALPTGPIDVMATITMEGDASAITEYANWIAVTNRLVRLELGNNGAVIGTSALKPRIMFDIPGTWTAIDMTPEDQSTKVYKFSYVGIYDSTNAYALAVTINTVRSTAF